MKVEKLAEKLISFETVSPVEDIEIFEFLADQLESEGLAVEIHDINGVKSLTAETGENGKSICFSGHLDVVPPEGNWETTEPFEPVIQDGKLYGRGATDMKGDVAAMVKAFVDLHRDPDFRDRATLMITGDEEIGGEDGTKHLLERYAEDSHRFDYAIVGEPTDLDIQTGTRGVLWLNVELEGDTIHTTRSDRADANVIEELPEAMNRIRELEFDYSEKTTLPPPSIEIGSVNTDETYNSLPGKAVIGADIRYLPDQKPQEIRSRVEEELSDLGCELKVEIEKDHGGAFELRDNFFRDAVTEAVRTGAQKEPDYITEGGASDGRFFAQHGTPFVELGTNQDMVHRDDEYCLVENLQKLRDIYFEAGMELSEEKEDSSIPKERPRASKL